MGCGNPRSDLQATGTDLEATRTDLEASCTDLVAGSNDRKRAIPHPGKRYPPLLPRVWYSSFPIIVACREVCAGRLEVPGNKL